MNWHWLRNILLLSLILVCTLLCAENEKEQLMTVKLKSGEKVIGTVVFQNSEVLVVRDLKGNRYQYPLSEIQTEALATEEDLNLPQKNTNPVQVPAVGLTLQLSGGVAMAETDETGGFVDVDLLVGHRNVCDKHVFIGGGTGVHSVFLSKESLLSIPLMLRVSLPLLPEKNNSPMVGFDGGYAFAVGGSMKAGLFAGFDIGWQFIIGKRTVINIALMGKVQQYNKGVYETIGEQKFSYTGIRMMYNYGLKFGIAL